MANNENLKPFKKGHKLATGRPKGSKNLATAWAKLLESDLPTKDGTIAATDAAVMAVFKQVLKGNIQAYKEMRDTVDGKPLQSIRSEGTLDITALDLSSMTDEQIERYLSRYSGD